MDHSPKNPKTKIIDFCISLLFSVKTVLIILTKTLTTTKSNFVLAKTNDFNTAQLNFVPFFTVFTKLFCVCGAFLKMSKKRQYVRVNMGRSYIKDKKLK